MSHITILFINFIYEHLPEIIELGWLYVGSAPLYRVNVKGKWNYFKNDNEYNSFLSDNISERYKVLNKNLSIKKLMKNYDEFMEEYNRIKTKYSVHNGVLDCIFTDESIDSIKKVLRNEFKLKTFKNGTVEGLYDSVWHSFNLKDMINEANDLLDIYDGIFSIKIKDIKNNTTNTYSIHEGLIVLKSAFKYVRNRLKGLGEMDGAELRLTSLDPDSRILIKLTKEETEEEKLLFTTLFGNNTDLRKEFVKTHLL